MATYFKASIRNILENNGSTLNVFSCSAQGVFPVREPFRAAAVDCMK